MSLALLCRRNRSVGDGRDIQGLAYVEPTCGIRGRPKYIARKSGRLEPGRVQDKCGESVLSDNLIAVFIAQSIDLLLVEQVFQLPLQILPVHVNLTLLTCSFQPHFCLRSFILRVVLAFCRFPFPAFLSLTFINCRLCPCSNVFRLLCTTTLLQVFIQVL